jgi:hypothetical protein
MGDQKGSHLTPNNLGCTVDSGPLVLEEFPCENPPFCQQGFNAKLKPVRNTANALRGGQRPPKLDNIAMDYMQQATQTRGTLGSSADAETFRLLWSAAETPSGRRPSKYLL